MRSKLHVVVGASGGLGSAILRQLAKNGNDVRGVVHRLPVNGGSEIPKSVELVQANALDGPSMLRACEDASVVYHTVNVPYQEWEKVMPVVTSNILSSAEAAGARLVFPGNVYGYGRFEGTEATEDHPLGATSRKGRLRNELERTLMEAYRSNRVKVVVPRFPDFYGPNVTNRIFGDLFLAALAGKRANWIGKLDVPHELVFIEDAAKASVLLAETEDAYGQAWHIPGPGPVSGRRFIETAFRAAGREPDIGVLSHNTIRLAMVVSTDARQMSELMYEFEEPLLLDGNKFAGRFPSFRFTPHEEAIRRTVEWFESHNPGRTKA